MKTSKFYGWIPDLPDKRDYIYVSSLAIEAFPTSVDLRPGCSPVEDQGQLGSCTGNAWVGALEFLEKKQNVPFKDLSRLFVYYNERVIEHTVREDAGAAIRDGAKALASYGVCDESLWPYNIKKYARKPLKSCFAEALSHKITSYHRINTITDMQGCLASGYPFVFGFTVYESFESQQVADTGVLNMPGGSESVVGGHAVLCVGYDLTKKTFLVRNSWGPNWGMQGYFTMPFDYLASRSLSDDFWVALK